MQTQSATSVGVPPDLIERLKAVTGPAGYLDRPEDIAPYCIAWRDNWTGRTPLVMRPNSTAELSRIVAFCAEHGVPMVPQGGNTGVTGGGQPHPDGSEIIVSTNRMRSIRAVDPMGDTITVEAGVPLAEIQAAARKVGRLFPVSLASEGTCEIGGNISTNAGGIQVLRYGSTRALVLGLEVVLPDGRVWNGLRALRKDSAGYDLKQIFIGAEGTLGIVSAAVLRLMPLPSHSETAMVGVDGPAESVRLLGRLRESLGERVTSFELLRRSCLDYTFAVMPAHSDPLAAVHPWYVMISVDGPDAGLRGQLEEALVAAMEEGLVRDAVVASSERQRAALLALREDQGEVQKLFGIGIKHDISVPVSRIAEFMERADSALEATYPGIRLYAFGHVGDGNIHYNPFAPADWDGAAFYAETAKVNRIVHDIVVELGGSISAEHGLGQLRLGEAEYYKAAVEMELMRRIKAAIDPLNLMNPGKVLRIRPRPASV
ncbi:MAG: FAD-binding oxidoreductase [Pseudolabrys sp.]